MGTVEVPSVPAAQRHDDDTRWTAVRPVSGTPLWARSGPNGGRAAVPPWEPWPHTPRDPARFAAKLAAVRETPKPTPSYAWRVAFDGSDAGPPVPVASVAKPSTVVNVAPVDTAAVSTAPKPVAALRKRIALLLGFAYMLLYALASGLALPLIAEAEPNTGEGEPEPAERPSPASAPPFADYRPRPHPRPDPQTPGLHVRPDGSRYLVVPLNFAGAAA